MSKTAEKVILVGPAYPYRGGQALVEAYLYDTLTKLGYEVETVSYSLLYPSVFFPGTTQYETSNFVPFAHPEKISRKLNSVNPLTWLSTARYIKTQKPALVIFVWWMPFFGPALGTIAKFLKKHTRITFLVENFVSHENRWFDRALTQRTLCYADAFICQSSYVRGRLEEAFPKTPVHQTTLSIYDCYDLKKYDKKSAREKLEIQTENVVLYFGLIRPYKGLDALIRSFPQLVAHDTDTTLLIVGECYENPEKYHKQIEESGVKAKIKFVDSYIPNEEVEPYFKAADFVCLPYNSASQSGIVMMAYGFRRPVLVTRVGGLPELIQEGNTGWVCEDNSPENLLPALKNALKDTKEKDFEGQVEAYIGKLGYKNMGTMLESILLKNEG